MSARRVVLYSRPGCHLCDDARAVLDDEQVVYTEIDIESADDLLRRYLERIPVIAIDDQDVFEFFVDREQLRAALGARESDGGHLQR
ncbi:MAG TPA: glutaredoxin family protein [Baekduia sp.]|nr:glutaredoxin family protein [Baekduia sp.]